MKEIVEEKKEPGGFFPRDFYYAFRSMFIPVTRFCIAFRIPPNAVTVFSMIMGIFMGVMFAFDRLYTGIVFGLAMAFSDIVDGQLARASDGSTKFGGILDSTVDRVNEFFLFGGFAVRYYLHGRPMMIIACAAAFFGSVMISYVKARAEADGFTCRVGKLQRPERLSLIGIGLLFRGTGIDVVVLFLAVATQFTALRRLMHVYRQSTEPEGV